MVPSKRPVNAAIINQNKGKSVQGSIYLEDNEAQSQAQSNIKFELIGTSVSKHNDSYRGSVNNSKTKTYPENKRLCRINLNKETNTNNMTIANDLGPVLNTSTANMNEAGAQSTSNRHARDNPREPGSAATVQTLMGPSFRGYDRSGTMNHEKKSNALSNNTSNVKSKRQQKGELNHLSQLPTFRSKQ